LSYHISQNKALKYYIRWLNSFLGYHDNRLDDVSGSDLEAFCGYPETRGYKKWQVKQAREAVYLIY